MAKLYAQLGPKGQVDNDLRQISCPIYYYFYACVSKIEEDKNQASNFSHLGCWLTELSVSVSVCSALLYCYKHSLRLLPHEVSSNCDKMATITIPDTANLDGEEGGAEIRRLLNCQAPRKEGKDCHLTND